MEVVDGGVRFSVAERGFRGDAISGDAWTAHSNRGRCRLAVIDGAGHGGSAKEAAAKACGVLEQDRGEDLRTTFAQCHAALRGTRGAVMTVAVIDTVSGQLQLAGVGNVEAYLRMNDVDQHLVTQRGLLGSTLPTLRPLDIPLDGEWVLVLHTDGVRARFRLGDDSLRSVVTAGPEALARTLIRGYAREDDDALIMVVMPETFAMRTPPSAHERP